MSLSASFSKSFGKMPDFRRTCIPYFHSPAFHGPVNSDSRFKHLQGRKVRESTANQHPNPEFPGEKISIAVLSSRRNLRSSVPIQKSNHRDSHNLLQSSRPTR